MCQYIVRLQSTMHLSLATILTYIIQSLALLRIVSSSAKNVLDTFLLRGAQFLESGSQSLGLEKFQRWPSNSGLNYLPLF